MRKKIALLLAVIIVISAFCFVGCRKGTEKDGNAQEGGNEQTSSHIPPELTPAYEGDLTDYGVINYSSEDYQNRVKSMRDSVASGVIFKPVGAHEILNGCGTQIYERINDYKTGEHVIISGAEVLPTSNGLQITGIDTNRVRNNITGYLVGLYETEEDAKEAEQEYAAAKRLLSGETKTDNPTLIMNGRLMKDTPFFIDDKGVYWLPITMLCERRGWSWEEDGCLLYITLLDYAKRTLTSENHPMTMPWLAGGDNGEAAGYNEFYYEGINVTWAGPLPLLQKKDGVWYATAETVSRVCGFEVLLGDNIVVVTSDPCDIPQQFFVWDASINNYRELKFK